MVRHMKNKKNKRTNKDNKTVMITIISLLVVVIIATICYFLFINDKTRIVNKGETVDPEFTWLTETDATQIENFDMYNSQSIMYNEILKTYKSDKPTLDNPMVIQNPFAISPLTALVLFKTDSSVSVKVTVKGKHNDDIVRTFEASKDHYLPIYGLYGGYDNTVVLETSDGKSKTITITVDSYNTEGNAEVVTNNVSNSNGEFYFGTSSLGASTIAYDNYGEVRWYLNIGYSKGMTMLQNGNILLSDASNGPDSTSTGGVVELDLLGYVHNEYLLEGGYHHDAYELPNGNLIVLTSDKDSDTFSDYVVELDRTTGQVVKDWKLKDIVGSIDSSITNNYPTWGWINSVYYDQTTNSLIFSLRNMNSVVSVGYDSGKINWILGDKSNWSNAFSQYFLTGIGSNFSYTSGQHSVSLTSDGYLSVFDNGYNAHNEEAVSCASLKNNESYAKVYKIDTANMTAELTYKYGGKDYFSYALSSFNYTDAGNKLINFGWHMTSDTDYSSSECTQFSASSYDAYLFELDANNNVSVELHMPQSKFEVVKADAYNLASVSVNPSTKDELSNYTASAAVRTTTNTKNYIELTKDEALAYKDGEKLEYAMVANHGRLLLNGAVADDKELDVVFIGLNGKGYKFVAKEAGKTSISEINFDVLPNGTYYVFVDYDGITYNALQYVVVDN